MKYEELNNTLTLLTTFENCNHRNHLSEGMGHNVQILYQLESPVTFPRLQLLRH